MNKSYYTIIDLGSNSFHMLTVEPSDNGFTIVDKTKQKVRLAAGLDANNNLNQQTMHDGWLCLENFADKLSQLNPTKVLVTATAALRLANNKQTFITRAQTILKQPINLISGIQEAKTIYRGVAFTEHCNEQLLVIDIGGASTELIIGQGTEIKIAKSLEMGCVTWLHNYFNDGELNETNFVKAIDAAKAVIQPHTDIYKSQGWLCVKGASGTIQAVNEINQVQVISELLTSSLLSNIKQQVIACETVKNVTIPGLKESRVPVFASGLAILIAIFESLEIKSIEKSNGALREGLISMMFNDINSFD